MTDKIKTPKNSGGIVRKITVVSALSLIIYYFTYAVLAEISERFSRPIPQAVLLAVSVLLMFACAFMYVWVCHVAGGAVRLSLRGKEYRGIGSDILDNIKSGRVLLLTVLLINMGCWVMVKAGLYTVRVARIFGMIFMPLNPLTLAHRYDVLSYVASSVLIYVFYVLILAIARKITYNKMFPKKKT